MTAASPPTVNFGFRAPDFRAADTRGRVWARDELRGPKGLVLLFLANDCPYVAAIADKLAREAKALHDLGFGVVAIASNDVAQSPADGVAGMASFARTHRFAFPYLHDVTQSIARAYGAVCTPDCFGFNSELQLQYRGRFDESGPTAMPSARRELYDAMREIASTGNGPREQAPAFGCAIKWKAA